MLWEWTVSTVALVLQYIIDHVTLQSTASKISNESEISMIDVNHFHLLLLIGAW